MKEVANDPRSRDAFGDRPAKVSACRRRSVTTGRTALTITGSRVPRLSPSITLPRIYPPVPPPPSPRPSPCLPPHHPCFRLLSSPPPPPALLPPRLLRPVVALAGPSRSPPDGDIRLSLRRRGRCLCGAAGRGGGWGWGPTRTLALRNRWVMEAMRMTGGDCWGGEGMSGRVMGNICRTYFGGDQLLIGRVMSC